MTDIVPIAESSPTWQQQLDARDELAVRVRPTNKAALLDALGRGGVQRVVESFDGSGDSGQIDTIEAFGLKDEALEFSAEIITLSRLLWDGSGLETSDLSLMQAAERLAYDLLEDTHGGWENNEGAYGEFVFDVASQTITLEYNERLLTSEYYQHVL